MPTTDRQQQWEQKLQAALTDPRHDLLVSVLAEIHAADLAELFPDFEEEEQQRILESLSDESAAELLDELDPTDRSKMLDQLPLERASDILEEMPSDEAADLLSELPPHEVDELLQRMEPELADDVTDLLRYPEDTAGGLMVKEFVHVTPEQTVEEVLSLLRRHHDDAEMIYYLYVLGDDDRLLGIFTLRKLIIVSPEATMADIMQREFVSVPVDMPQDEVAEAVRRHDLLAVPVLDPDGRMLGIVTVDDIGDVVQEEAAEELLEMSGSAEEEESPRPWFSARGWRSGLLALAGGLIAAVVIWLLSRSISAGSLSAILLPILLVLGITTGSQAALAMDRAYDNAVERQQTGRIFLRELEAGAILACLGGVLAGLLAFLTMGHHVTDAVAIAVPMAVGLWVAAICGALGALIVRRRGGWLGTTSHTVVVVVALLLAIAVTLLLSRWTMTL